VADEPQAGATPPVADPADSATLDSGQQGTGDGATPDPSSTEGATPDHPLGDAGREALEKERTKRRDADRQLAEARQRIADLEDVGRSDDERRAAAMQRATGELTAAQRRISELEAQAAARELNDLKRDIAVDEGLSASMAPRLAGDDARSIRADAKKLAAELNAVRPGDPGIGRGGTAAGLNRGKVDMNSLIREAAGRR
jgi:hypothetical protein